MPESTARPRSINFASPGREHEIILVGELPDEFGEDDGRIGLLQDLPSTDRTLFLARYQAEPTDSRNIVERWFCRAAPRYRDHVFTNEVRPGKRAGIGKNWIHRRHGIPTASCGVTTRPTGRRSGVAMVFTEALMALMLESLAESW